MCGRYTLNVTPEELAEFFAVLRGDIVARPRWNISPTQTVGTVRGEGQTDCVLERVWREVRWGLIPSWAKDAKIANSLLNARSETLTEKPSFRNAFKRRRCLIPASGYYEWTTVPGQKLKQPLLYLLVDQPLFAMAGLWETWNSSHGPLETCTIITTEPNELAAQSHDRMPVILDRDAWDEWLDPENRDTDELRGLLIPYSSERMQVMPVSSVINKSGVEVDPTLP